MVDRSNLLAKRSLSVVFTAVALYRVFRAVENCAEGRRWYQNVCGPSTVASRYYGRLVDTILFLGLASLLKRFVSPTS